MTNTKPMNIPLRGHFKLSEAQTSMTEDEKALMSEVPYASIVGSLMYAIVCTRPYIVQAESCRQVYEQFWKGALENSKENLEIYEKEFGYNIVL